MGRMEKRESQEKGRKR